MPAAGQAQDTPRSLGYVRMSHVVTAVQSCLYTLCAISALCVSVKAKQAARLFISLQASKCRIWEGPACNCGFLLQGQPVKICRQLRSGRRKLVNRLATPGQPGSCWETQGWLIMWSSPVQTALQPSHTSETAVLMSHWSCEYTIASGFDSAYACYASTAARCLLFV